jgi:hypothetical protein
MKKKHPPNKKYPFQKLKLMKPMFIESDKPNGVKSAAHDYAKANGFAVKTQAVYGQGLFVTRLN